MESRTPASALRWFVQQMCTLDSCDTTADLAMMAGIAQEVNRLSRNGSETTLTGKIPSEVAQINGNVALHKCLQDMKHQVQPGVLSL